VIDAIRSAPSLAMQVAAEHPYVTLVLGLLTVAMAAGVAVGSLRRRFDGEA
jgi:hypothetical protein